MINKKVVAGEVGMTGQEFDELSLIGFLSLLQFVLLFV